MGPAAKPPGAAAWRPAIAELAFALVSILLAEVVLVGVLKLGLLPPHQGQNPVWMLYGPARTVLALVVYRILATTTADLVLPPIRARDERPRLSIAALWLACGIAAAAVGSIGIASLSEVLGLPVEEQAAIAEFVVRIRASGDWAAAAALATSALLLAPVAEEVLFRGFLFGRIAAQGTLFSAYLLSASAFAFIHGNLSGFLVYAWLGVVFASVYRATGRLWVAVAVHAANNGLALLLLFADLRA